MKGHDDESARRICGELQQRLEGKAYSATISKTDKAQSIQEKKKVLSYQDNGRLFLKVFLIDGSVNMNDWGVDPQSIRKNINTAIGKPVVLYKTTQGEWDHPPLSAQEDLDHALAFQDLYRVATYIDVFESKTKPNEWWGIAEVTDEGVKQAIREDPTIPFYVSPTIRLTNPLQNETSLSEWAFMHSAIVDRPAFGTNKAFISGHCNGDSNTCLLQLRKASIKANDGKVGCGFCTYKAAKNIQQKIVSSQLTSNQQLQNRNYIMSSDNQGNNASNQQSSDAQNQQNQQNNRTPTVEEENQRLQNQQQRKEVKQETKTEVQETSRQQQPSGNADENAGQRGDNRNEENTGRNNNNNKQASAQELLEAIQRLSTQKRELELQLQQARADVETHKNLNNQFNDRLARLEQERDEERRVLRANEITNYVNSAPAYKLLTPNERAQQIESFVKGSMSVDDIKQFIEPLNASVQKASFGINRSASYTPRLSLGGRTGNTVEVRSASEQSPNQEEVPYYLGLANAMFKGKSEV